MAVFKCKMCGGTIEFEQGATVGVCDSCGTKQTLPRLDSDRKANLYDRADHFRRSNEYDKAMGIYEQILNEDGTDAEAYWSIVLCRYGIEYVEDPQSHKRIPTVNRTQFTSIYMDEDYKSALANADGYQRSIYEDEAKAIDNIQKGILEISSKEEPFDVFISFKETGADGRRTRDAVLAHELYGELIKEGFKVFFAPVTLEDKLGQEYEPYIFAALNSSKVMVVVGTKPEHFNAVWVKNEWSRYLSLIKKGANKTLIPAYRDMDPYDLPKEFSHLMAQDMSKLGFMQDLTRGIKKIIAADAPTTAVKETVAVNNAQSTNIATLLERVFLFLEDGKWQDANIYCEKVLDIDPKNAESYLGKLMVELHVKTREHLSDCEQSFDSSDNYAKIIRFGDEKLEDELRGYISCIEERNENSRKDAAYASAKAKMTGESTYNYENAIGLFKTISDWKDSGKQIDICQRKIEEIKAKEETDRIEAERQAELKRIEAEKTAKKRKKIISIATPAVIFCIAAFFVVTKVIIPNNRYNTAIALMDNREYEAAISAFEGMNGYKDSAAQIENCQTAIMDNNYKVAIALMNSGDYKAAISAFEGMNGYKDSAAQIENCKTAIMENNYDAAVALMNSGDYEAAISAFEAMDSYKDSAEKIENCKTGIKDNNYNVAAALMESGDYEAAITAFEAMDGYKDSAAQIKNCQTALLNVADIGDTVYFGAYEQDNDTSNGKENIEWLVLDKDGTSILVISKYALDSQEYTSNTDTDVTWGTCSLRTWLNKTFLNEAFSQEETAMIATATVTADKNPKFSTNAGYDTQDQVFLLSITEAEKYFSSDSARQCEATAYAEAQGAYDSDSNGNCWWWLRSPGCIYFCAACVYKTGSVYYSGNDVTYVNRCVRPAMWISID